MERFVCPDHGRLVVQLAQGRLDDAEALSAERAAESCPHCAAWWQATFDAAAVVALDEAVAEGFAAFRAPRRAGRRWWLAAAAAAIVTLGVGTLWWQQPPRSTGVAAETASASGAAADAVLSRFTFEDGAIEVAEVVVEPASPTREPSRSEPAVIAPALRESSFESGDLSGWSSHT